MLFGGIKGVENGRNLKITHDRQIMTGEAYPYPYPRHFPLQIYDVVHVHSKHGIDGPYSVLLASRVALKAILVAASYGSLTGGAIKNRLDKLTMTEEQPRKPHEDRQRPREERRQLCQSSENPSTRN
jgi:hypothetical protein